MVYFVYSLESPRWGDSNENTQYTIMLKNAISLFLFPVLALWLTLTSSNYPCLEHIFIVPKVFESLKFECKTTSCLNLYFPSRIWQHDQHSPNRAAPISDTALQSFSLQLEKQSETRSNSVSQFLADNLPPQVLLDDSAAFNSLSLKCNRCSGSQFLIYETEFVLFLAVLENSVLPMGWDSSHAMLIKTSKF